MHIPNLDHPIHFPGSTLSMNSLEGVKGILSNDENEVLTQEKCEKYLQNFIIGFSKMKLHNNQINSDSYLAVVKNYINSCRVICEKYKEISHVADKKSDDILYKLIESFIYFLDQNFAFFERIRKESEDLYRALVGMDGNILNTVIYSRAKWNIG